MTKYLGIINGKGGVGKTTISLNLAFCLKDIHKTLLFDGNLANPHLGLHLGKKDPDHSIQGATLEHNHITKAIHDLYGINVVLGRINAPYDVDRLKQSLSGVFDFGEKVVVDCPPGNFEHVLQHCDECILVTTPDPVSLAEAYRAKAVAQKYGVNPLGIVLNRVSKKAHEIGQHQVEKFLGLPMLAVIPEDSAIQQALSRQQPVVHYKPRAKSSREFLNLAKHLSH